MGDTSFTPGPYSWDAFNEVVAGEPIYDAMILGGDGETIVAQCVADRDVPLLMAAPDLFEALDALMREFFPSAKPDDYPEWTDARAALAKARGAS